MSHGGGGGQCVTRMRRLYVTWRRKSACHIDEVSMSDGEGHVSHGGSGQCVTLLRRSYVT